jgi:hypothetical protein
VRKSFQKFSSIHPSIHPPGCFSVGFFWRRLSLVSRDRRGVRSWRVCGRAGRLEGTTHCELASAGGIFAMHKMKIPFLLDVLCFFFPLENLSHFLFTGLFLVMDSSRSAGVQEVRGERESQRIFSSSSKLLLLLRL